MNFLCRQKWLAWLSMVLLTLDDKGKIMHYHCCQWNPILSSHLVRTVPKSTSGTIRHFGSFFSFDFCTCSTLFSFIFISSLHVNWQLHSLRLGSQGPMFIHASLSRILSKRVRGVSLILVCKKMVFFARFYFVMFSDRIQICFIGFSVTL